MAALTAPYDARRKDGGRVRYGVAANTRVFKGGLAVLGLTTNQGYAQPGADTAGVVFVGVFCDSVDNTTGATPSGQVTPGIGSPNLNTQGGPAGALTVKVEKAGTFVFGKAAAAQADIGKACFVVDDNTVSTAATANNIACGYVTELVDAAHVRVRIDRAAQ